MEVPRVAIFISSVVLSLRERMTTTKNECNSKALWTPTPFHGLWLLLLLCVMKPQRKGFDSNRSQEPAVRLKGERGRGGRSGSTSENRKESTDLLS